MKLKEKPNVLASLAFEQTRELGDQQTERLHVSLVCGQ